jgi:cell division protein FtsB
VDVDARGEPLLDQRAGEVSGPIVVGHGRQDNDEVRHRPCTFSRGVVLFFHVPKKAETKPGSRRRIPAPKRPTRHRRIIQGLVLLVASIIIVDGLVGDRGLLAMLRARHEYDQLAASIARQRAENARLRDQARRLREDPGAIEEIARRELGLIKPGERVFIVRDIPAAKAPR